jgi:alpha-tubulin suppressor-like RCC1 family protein
VSGWVKRSLLWPALLAAACVEQPLVPRVGVPTLDDAGADNFIAVSAGLEHTCALTADGSAHCWGSNEYGQLGAVSDTTCPRDDRRIACSLRPVAVNSTVKFQKISAGGVHTCAIATDSRIYCWGDNLRGPLGDPVFRTSNSPIPIASSATFIDVAAGGQHTCGLKANGVMICWGANDDAQLGLGTINVGSAVPDSVRTSLRFASVSAAGQRTCARTSDGTPYCWGALWVANAGSGNLFRIQTNPQRVTPAPSFKSLSVGTNTTCGISIEGSTATENQAYCWEANPSGGIGDGTVAGSSSPRLVRGSANFVAVSAGALQTCAIADTGLAYCWGGDTFGQLGVSSVFLNERCGESRVPCSTVPVRVSGWRVFSQITAGQGDHACALTLAGNVFCWGAGGMGQRGDGRPSVAEWSPVKTGSPHPL